MRDDQNELHYSECRVNCTLFAYGSTDECDEHDAHWCTCDDIAAARGEREAEAAAEHLETLGERYER